MITENILTEVEDNIMIVQNEVKHYSLKLSILESRLEQLKSRLEQLNEQKKSIENYLNTEL